MAKKVRRLDPESSRRRVELIAEISEVQAVRDRVAPRRARLARLRQLVDSRRRRA